MEKTGKPGGLPSTGSHRVGHNWGDLAAAAAAMEKIGSVQSLNRVWLFVTPWTAAHQASLSFTNSQSLIKLISIESVMPSNHLILSRPLLLLPQSFPSSGSFPMSQFFASGGQGIGVSASASVLPMNIQDWFPLGWTGWISLQSKRLSESSPTPQFKSINTLVFSFLYSPTLKSIHDNWKPTALTSQTFVGKVMSLFFNMLYRLVMAFLFFFS